MSRALRSLLRWMTSSPTHVLAVVGVAVLGGAAGTALRRRAKALELAAWMAEQGQCQAAPAEFVDGLVEEGARHGHRDLVLSELANIRSLYGDDGVRMGHLVWVMKRMDGEVPAGTRPPAFTED